jgi:hypothetical protein
MHDAPLHDRGRERRVDRVGEAGQAVDAGDEDVADAAVAQVGRDAAPEAGEPSPAVAVSGGVLASQMPRTCFSPSASTPTAT